MPDPDPREYDDERPRPENPPDPEHVTRAKMHEQTQRHPDAEQLPFRIADPVMDAAQGRPMVVTGVPQQTVAEWSGDNGYDLTDNYGNRKFGVDPNEPVVEAVYLSNVKNEPNRSYTFPQSRLRLIDVHHADDGRRVYDAVVVDVLRRLFVAAEEIGELESPAEWEVIDVLAGHAGIAHDAISEAHELADVDRRFGGDGDG